MGFSDSDPTPDFNELADNPDGSGRRFDLDADNRKIRGVMVEADPDVINGPHRDSIRISRIACKNVKADALRLTGRSRTQRA